MTLLATRVAALITLFALTFIVGILPPLIFTYLLQRKRKLSFDIFNSDSNKIIAKKTTALSTSGTVILQLLMFFGGGVLLSTCFLHLIPEVRDSFDNYFKNSNTSGYLNENGTYLHEHGDDHDHEDSDHEHNHTHFHNDTDGDKHTETSDEHGHSHNHDHSHSIPYVELAICAGFFLVYLLEELMHAAFGHSHHHHHHSHSNAKKDDKNISNYDHDTSSTSSQSSTVTDEIKKREYYETNDIKKQKPSITATTSSTCLATYRNHHNSHQISSGYDNYAVDYSGETIQTIANSVPVNDIIPVNDKEEVRKYYDSSDEISDFKLPALVRFVQGLVTIGAFSAHSIFDGVAIGLQESNSQVWSMLFAICVHKLVVAFVIGIELFEQTSSVLITSIHIMLFSLTSPIGILLVIFTESSISDGHGPVLIFLSAIATGTILYIIFFEILKKDRCAKLNGFCEFLAMLVGFTIMTCINLFIAH